MVKGGEGGIIQNKVTGKFERIREGEINRERIFQFIYKNRNQGARTIDIINDTRFSKQTVNIHLRILLNEKRIYKKKHRFYPEISILNEFLSFSKLMNQQADWLIDKNLMEASPDAEPYGLEKYPRLKLHQKIEKLPESENQKVSIFDHINKATDDINKVTIPGADYFAKMLSGPITSKKYCVTHFGHKDSLERSLFEFSNRIGAYITYIFLQALHPLDSNTINNEDRGALTRTLIERSISLEDIFVSFRYLITQLGLTSCNLDSDEHKKLFELSNNNFNTLSKGLEKIYSNLYIGIENWWLHATLNTLALHDLRTTSSTCNHIWEKKYLFKYGSCKYCKKCHGICSSSKLTKKKN